jgi:signal transduction histidine kinase/HAMP domain-containing protein/CheY-like chemotaxis protein
MDMAGADGPVRPPEKASRAQADIDVSALLACLRAARAGDFSVRLVPEHEGPWTEVAAEFNGLLDDLVWPTTELARVIGAVADGDLSQKMALETSGQSLNGEFLRIGRSVNGMVDQLSALAHGVTQVAREVGTEGKLGGQAVVPGAAGRWRALTESVNLMASNLTDQVRNIAQVTTAVAQGDLSQKITVEASGEVAGLADTINSMTGRLQVFAEQVTTVARQVGTEGKLGSEAEVPGVGGTWKNLTESVNLMASNLTDQVRNIAQVTTAVAQGDLSQKITAEAEGEFLELKNTINTMVDQLSSFADEVTRVAREVGTEGKLGGQADVQGVSGTWRGLTESVNGMASNLTDQVRNIAQVATAVAGGDLSQKITAEAEGEILELKDTINTMVEQLRSFAAEVTRVAREVGTEGKLGGQAEVAGVSGTWRDLTENVNLMGANLTAQVRNIAQVTTAVARGDLSQKITVDAKGEIFELKDTINTMVDHLSSFADEVTRVAREVGTEGRLGGQAEVSGVSGTWRRLTERVNQLAGNLTTQVRAIAEVSTAVANGDLTRAISVEAQGEVAELKDNINQMIANLRDTTIRNQEQNWLKTNLARTTGLMQGQRELATVTRLIMSELTPTVSAQHGAFFLTEPGRDGGPNELRLAASYGYVPSGDMQERFAFGEALVGQAALERSPIYIDDAPDDYILVSSGLGRRAPASILITPVLFEDRVLGVIELAWLRPPTRINRTFVERLMETVGVVLNTIIANMRTEELLRQSRSLNAELEQQAQLLEQRNLDIEAKNREIEEKAAQLTLSSRYKSEFLANMSHELRTPLNSLLILSKLLVDNGPDNLTDKQLEFARTIRAAGADLLQLINDVLDLSKIEAGKMDLVMDAVSVADVCAYVRRTFQPVASLRGLELETVVGDDVPPTIVTDEQRLQQVLRNLLANAFKFTLRGGVTLRIEREGTDAVTFSVIDTGTGIAEEKLGLIFEAFEQADGTTSRTYGGTGLGLSISRELARALGGEITVQSTVGTGSVFTLRLRLDYASGAGFAVVRPGGGEAPEAMPAEAETVHRTPAHPAVIRRLVILDRGELAMDVIRRLVGRDHGVQLTGARDPEEALAALAGSRPDGLIIGSGVSKAAVFALLDELRADEHRRRLPVILRLDRRLTERDRLRLRGYEPALMPRVAESDEELTAEAALVLHPASGPEVAAHIRAEADARATPDSMQGRVLLVDDDVRNLFALASVLEDRGLDVAFSENGQEALEILRTDPRIDLVLMDIMMPQMDGNETIRAVRAIPELRTMPIIAVTAKAMQGDREESIDSGASDYITKPVDADRLISLVDGWLGRASG